jgi:hypothetical protein
MYTFGSETDIYHRLRHRYTVYSTIGLVIDVYKRPLAQAHLVYTIGSGTDECDRPWHRYIYTIGL